MRSLKLILGIFAFSLFGISAVAAVPASSNNIGPSMRSDINPTVSTKQQQLTYMKWFVSLSPGEYGKWRGKKLNLVEKISFKLTQYRMKLQLRNSRNGESEGVNWGALALGFFLGPLGVLGAYVFSGKRNFIKWAWIGCGILLVLGGLVIGRVFI